MVVPVWDDYVSDRLGEALASVRAQDRQAPIVVVDNASSTRLPPLPGTLVVRAPARLTLGEARNLGLSRVTTPYVVFWDADDLMLPGTLAFLETQIAAQPKLAAYGMAIVEEPTGRRHRWPRRWIARLARAPQIFALLHSIWSLYPSTGATIMRSDLARAAHGYGDADSGEDWCLGVSLAFRGHIGWSEQPGRLYRVHSSSTWAQHMTPGDLRRHARAVRERIRSDAGIPEWVRTSLPLIGLGQGVAIRAHVLVQTARTLRHQAAIRGRAGVATRR